MGSVASYLQSRDKFGHPFSVNYKGKKTFKTLFGAAITTIIQVLVLVIFLLKIMALMTMSNADIISYERPIYIDEITELDNMYMKDFNFNFGIAIMQSGPEM